MTKTYDAEEKREPRQSGKHEIDHRKIRKIHQAPVKGRLTRSMVEEAVRKVKEQRTPY